MESRPPILSRVRYFSAANTSGKTRGSTGSKTSIGQETWLSSAGLASSGASSPIEHGSKEEQTSRMGQPYFQGAVAGP